MTISMDKQYRTADGHDVFFLVKDKYGDYPHIGIFRTEPEKPAKIMRWNEDGMPELPYSADQYRLIELKPRIQREYWVNVYPNMASGFFPTKSDACYAPYADRIACVKVVIDCEEGEGL